MTDARQAAPTGWGLPDATLFRPAPRERAGLVIAIVALAIALNPLNLQFRLWLRELVAAVSGDSPGRPGAALRAGAPA